MSNREQELLDLNQKLLNAIVCGDWEVYRQLCDEDLTCFEPEAGNNQVRGLLFHKYFFTNVKTNTDNVAHMIAPIVKFMNDNACVITYTRLMQQNPSNPVMTSFQETRIWQLKENGWKHIHFHKSKL
jgi:calcium/calmodulin-dependent protein kinase (CaM kinase) II